MTTAQQLINQGVNQGLHKGIELNKIDTVKKGHLNGISNDLLVNISGLSIREVEKIIEKVKSGLL